MSQRNRGTSRRSQGLEKRVWPQLILGLQVGETFLKDNLPISTILSNTFPFFRKLYSRDFPTHEELAQRTTVPSCRGRNAALHGADGTQGGAEEQRARSDLRLLPCLLLASRALSARTFTNRAARCQAPPPAIPGLSRRAAEEQAGPAWPPSSAGL